MTKPDFTKMTCKVEMKLLGLSCGGKGSGNVIRDEIVKSSADGMNHYDYCAKEYPGWGDSGTEWKDRDGHSFSASEFF